MSKYIKEYKLFFESPAGQSFIQHVELLINQQHDKAENDPDYARDYTQRAKGLREILNHIKTTTTPVKKGGVRKIN